MSLGRKVLCSWISHQKTLFSCAEELLDPLAALQMKLRSLRTVVCIPDPLGVPRRQGGTWRIGLPFFRSYAPVGERAI